MPSSINSCQSSFFASSLSTFPSIRESLDEIESSIRDSLDQIESANEEKPKASSLPKASLRPINEERVLRHSALTIIGIDKDGRRTAIVTPERSTPPGTSPLPKTPNTPPINQEERSPCLPKSAHPSWEEDHLKFIASLFRSGIISPNGFGLTKAVTLNPKLFEEWLESDHPKKITHLNLEDRGLHWLPAELHRFTSLTEVNFQNNPIDFAPINLTFKILDSGTNYAKRFYKIFHRQIGEPERALKPDLRLVNFLKGSIKIETPLPTELNEKGQLSEDQRATIHRFFLSKKAQEIKTIDVSELDFIPDVAPLLSNVELVYFANRQNKREVQALWKMATLVLKASENRENQAREEDFPAPSTTGSPQRKKPRT